MYDAVCLQFAELLGEHLRRGLRKISTQFAEAKRLVDQMIENDRLILAANHPQNGIYRAVVHSFLFHIYHQTFDVFWSALLFFIIATKFPKGNTHFLDI